MIENILTSQMLMCHFNSSKKICLLTDTSRLHGLGFALGHMKKDNDGSDRFKIVTCASKSLTSAQNNYSTIELECLAIVWAIQNCSYYLLGQKDFIVLTDHKPLEGIFEKTIQTCVAPLTTSKRKSVCIFLPSEMVSWKNSLDC